MQAARQRMVDYISMAGLRKTMSHGGAGKLPPTMEYFKAIGARLNDASADQFDENSILFGSPERIIATLKGAEEIGIEAQRCRDTLLHQPASQERKPVKK